VIAALRHVVVIAFVAAACGGGRTVDSSDAALRARIGATVDEMQAVYARALATDGSAEAYRAARLEIVVGDATTACGPTEGLVGFYCEVDESIHVELGTYRRLRSQAGGDDAHAYIVAHELGHHVQHLRGELDLPADAAPDDAEASARRELQADCYAGVWAHAVTRAGYGTPAATAQTFALLGAAPDAVPDAAPDTAPDAAPGRHGTASARLRAFGIGRERGSLAACAARNPSEW